MSGEEIARMVLSALLSGGVAALSAVVALKVHVAWIKETLERHERAISRAHERIDDIREVSK